MMRMRDEPSGTAGAQQVTSGRFKRFEAREFMGGCTVGTQDLVLPFTRNLSIDLNKKSLYFHFSLEKREFNRFTNLGCFQPFVLPCHREHELVVSVRRPPICVNIRYKVWPPLVGTRSRAIRRGTPIDANKRHIRSTGASGHGRSRKRASRRATPEVIFAD
jgi:hypothetical protein